MTYAGSSNISKTNITDLDQEVSQFLTLAWSKGTMRTRNSQWHRYMSFCGDNDLTPLPASDMDVCRFLVYLARTCKFSTINNYLSAIISLHKYFGYEASFRESYLIKLLLSGFKNELGTAVSAKHSLSVDQLLLMYKNLDLSDLNVVTLWSALIFTFRTMLRKCNVVPDGQGEDQHVRRKHIEVTDKGILVHVCTTKTLKHKDRILKVPVHYVDNQGLCAASMLLAHFLRRPGDPNDNLFYLLKKGAWVPMCYNDLLGFLKAQVAKLGLDPSLYGLHSLRRAAATYYHQLGLSLTDVMLLGDWKSLAVFQYLTLSIERKSSIECFISQKLSDHSKV